jgi:hypothetical protein
MKAIDEAQKDSVIEANLATVEAHFHNEALNKIEKACALVTVRAKEPAEHKIYDLSVKFLRPIWL